MLIKGMLVGFIFAVASLIFYMRWLTSEFGKGGPMAIDIRVIEQFFASFFGGMGIGVAIVVTIVLGAGYALRAYMRHAAGV